MAEEIQWRCKRAERKGNPRKTKFSSGNKALWSRIGVNIGIYEIRIHLVWKCKWVVWFKYFDENTRRLDSSKHFLSMLIIELGIVFPCVSYFVSIVVILALPNYSYHHISITCIMFFQFFIFSILHPSSLPPISFYYCHSLRFSTRWHFLPTLRQTYGLWKKNQFYCSPLYITAQRLSRVRSRSGRGRPFSAVQMRFQNCRIYRKLWKY